MFFHRKVNLFSVVKIDTLKDLISFNLKMIRTLIKIIFALANLSVKIYSYDENIWDDASCERNKLKDLVY